MPTLYMLTYSQTFRTGKHSQTKVGSGSRPESQHSSAVASRTYSEFFGQVSQNTGLRHQHQLVLLTH